MAQEFSVGTNLNVVPGPMQQTLENNFLDFSTGWAQQYLPELYEAEVERYGNRMLSGFLSKVGAEEAMMSDQVVWSEQGRLHLSVTTAATADIANDNLTFGSVADAKLFRLNDTVLLYCTAGTSIGKSIKVLVTSVADHDSSKVKVIPYTQATLDASGGGAITFGTDSVFRAMVYGSEFKKGVSITREALTPQFKSFNNKPIIIRDKFQVSGSDTAQIGWVEVTGEEGQNGYLWYLKAEGDTRSRFNDYMEMTMLEAERATGAQLDSHLGTGGSGTGAEGGTEGLFAAITDRGHISLDTFNSATNSTSNHVDMAVVDSILVKLDAEGAIEENMLYLDRTENLAVDNMLGFFGSGVALATGYGLFDNSEEMALNLGFTGFRRGSYDFYKTDWKYLNDKMAYGSMTGGLTGEGKISGVLCPAGTTSVYDETMGKNMKRPFLHVRYRASNTDNRRLKTWITGSVGGNITSDLDAMQVNYLSERCLVTQAANNFMLFKR